MEIRRDRRMTFLLINYEYPPIGAGAATATQAIAKNLVELGHRVTVLTARYRGLPKICVESGVVVHRVRCLRRHRDRCNLIEMASFVISATLSLPSVVMAHRPNCNITFFSIPCGPVALVAKALFGLPYVISLRGGDVPGLTPEVNRMHLFLRALRRVILDNAIAIVANAEGLQKMAQTTDCFRVSVIPNGVDTDFFRPTPEAGNGNNRPFRFVFTGRFQAQKNVSMLLEQCAALRQHLIMPFELHLVGDGPMRQQLEEQADRLRLNDRVTWHGWTRREQLRSIYQKSDCFVNPSFYEGMPNAVLEAMACAKPIVASCVAGNDAVVQHGRTGFLFQLEKPESLCRSLKTIIDDPARAEAMGQNGRDWAERNFSWRQVAASYAALFGQTREEAPRW
jgi:glycosyltransferase involved in cell wall biosynthesis